MLYRPVCICAVRESRNLNPTLLPESRNVVVKISVMGG